MRQANSKNFPIAEEQLDHEDPTHLPPFLTARITASTGTVYSIDLLNSR